MVRKINFIPLITHRLSHDAQANYFYCVLCLTKWRFNEAQLPICTQNTHIANHFTHIAHQKRIERTIDE